jgi:hypothetical protein
MKNLTRDSRYPVRDLKCRPTEHKAGVLIAKRDDLCAVMTSTHAMRIKVRPLHVDTGHSAASTNFTQIL